LECKHFGTCGACRVYESGYDGQLQEKIALNKERFSSFYSDEIKVFESPDAHYRSRSEFKLWHDGDAIHYAMNNATKDGVIFIEECPQVSLHISNLMPKLLQAIEEKEIGFKLFGIDFLSATSGEIVISMLYHRRVDEAWQEKASEIAEELGIYIIGRSRKQKVVIGQDYITEKLTVKGVAYRFKHIENSFTQPNATVNEKMITWAMNALEGVGGDLLELYCGAGNFTIPFATMFNRVLATEISKSSINAAKENMRLNSVTNIEFLRMDVVDFVGALDGVREYRRMKDVDIDTYNIDTIFVDPPRSGMDEYSCKFASRYENILYVSCNPETLLRDLELLSATHTVVDMAIFDQFPYTHHVEMGVKLSKKEIV
jgi:tRNA (uracil-5-)-methyltransferase